MRKLKYIFIRLVFNALFALILLKCFIFGSQYGVELIGLNNWLIQLFCGISTALLFNAVLSLAQRTILLYLKHLQIASICVPDRNPNAVVFSRIGTVSVITCKFYIRFLIIRMNTILSNILKYRKTLILPRIYHD